MSARPVMVFRVWTTLLSIVFAVLLFPNITGKYGILLSLLFTAGGVGVIWLMYFGIKHFLDWLVSEELKRRNIHQQQDKRNKLPDTDIR